MSIIVRNLVCEKASKSSCYVEQKLLCLVACTGTLGTFSKNISKNNIFLCFSLME